MRDEPVAGQVRGDPEGPRLLEQVARAGDDDDAVLAAQPGRSCLVEFQHLLVVTSDDQQGGRTDTLEPWTGQVRPTAPRHDGDDVGVRCGGRPECGRRAGAGAEEPHRKAAETRLSPDPGHRLRGLCRLLPLPCTNTTSPVGRSGTVR
jgi:hypothetical protein